MIFIKQLTNSHPFLQVQSNKNFKTKAKTRGTLIKSDSNFGISRQNHIVKSIIWNSLEKINIFLLETPLIVKPSRNRKEEIRNT